MRGLARCEVFALAIVLQVCSFAAFCDCNAWAQTEQIAPAQATPQKQFIPTKQIPLTEKQVLGVLAAAEAIRQIPDAPENIGKLDAVARMNGLASYDEYKTVTQTVGLTCAGFDRVTKKYVGRVAAIHAEMTRTKADRKMSTSAKAGELARLNEQLDFVASAAEYQGNIDLLAKSNYCDRVGEAALKPLD